MFTILKRIFESGIKNFKRQGNISFAASSVLIITISLISFLFLFHQILGFIVGDMRAKADVSVYFEQDAPEQEIFDLQDKLADFPEVKEIEYVSPAQALENFIIRHKYDEDLMESLQELGANPFLSCLNIKAIDASSYEAVVGFLENDDFEHLIKKIDFFKRKETIEKIFSITSFIDKSGLIVSLVLAFVSILITYNTIRLTIFNQKQEIGIARLVGASNWFVRGPFLVQGAMCGILAFVISFLLVGSCFYFLSPRVSTFFPGFEIFDFFKNSFQAVFLMQFILGLVLGIIPSFIAIRKYLDI